jgi:ATP-binding cassette, subfamily C (CFTR/MRP), member 1
MKLINPTYDCCLFLHLALWLEWWSNANAKQPNGRLGFYIGVYAVIFVLNLTGLAVACW